MAKLIKIIALQDNNGHWFVIPKDRYDEFKKDEDNEEFVDSGEFGEKWGEYMTGGDLNNTQLYAEI